MPRTWIQAIAFVLGMWLAIELLQPIGLVGPRGLAAARDAYRSDLRSDLLPGLR